MADGKTLYLVLLHVCWCLMLAAVYVLLRGCSTPLPR